MKSKRLQQLPGICLKQLVLILVLAVFQGFVVMPDTYGQNEKPELPERKQTTLGLYLTAAEAYEMWKANRGTI